MEPSQAPTAASTTCRLCGGPAGPSEECPRCEIEVSAYIAGLMADLRASEAVAESEVTLEEIASSETQPEEVAEPEIALAEIAEQEVELEEIAERVIELEEDPEVPVEYEALVEPQPPGPRKPRRSALGHRRRPRRLVVAAVALGALATAGSLAVSQGDSGGPAPAQAPEQVTADPPATTAPPSPAPSTEPVAFGDWSGRVQVAYDDGIKDEMAVSLRIGPLERGEVVGISEARQNGTECRGSLTYLGPVDGVLRFAYRERNTAECIATGMVRLTPRPDDRLAYEEVTDISVNRGTLTRD